MDEELVRPFVDAIDGADLDAGLVLDVDARFGDHIRHRIPPMYRAGPASPEELWPGTFIFQSGNLDSVAMSKILKVITVVGDIWVERLSGYSVRTADELESIAVMGSVRCWEASLEFGRCSSGYARLPVNFAPSTTGCP
jgi:hypothetical protein